MSRPIRLDPFEDTAPRLDALTWAAEHVDEIKREALAELLRLGDHHVTRLRWEIDRTRQEAREQHSELEAVREEVRETRAALQREARQARAAAEDAAALALSLDSAMGAARAGGVHFVADDRLKTLLERYAPDPKLGSSGVER